MRINVDFLLLFPDSIVVFLILNTFITEVNKKESSHRNQIEILNSTTQIGVSEGSTLASGMS